MVLKPGQAGLKMGKTMESFEAKGQEFVLRAKHKENAGSQCRKVKKGIRISEG